MNIERDHEVSISDDQWNSESSSDLYKNISNDTSQNVESNYSKMDETLQQQLDYLELDAQYEIPPDQLAIVSVLGEGFFSEVYHGLLSQPNGKVSVAVKKRKCSSEVTTFTTLQNRNQRKMLRAELKIMSYLQSVSGGHENVLKVVGAITTIREDFSVLFEYCELGSLDQFLRQKFKDGKFENEIVSQKNSDSLNLPGIMWKVLHRDVALRNVLLKADFTLKVADFGLSKKLNDGDDAYHIWRNNSILPIRYLAPESLTAGRFTIHSECWSFGIVVWELFTFAQHQPYAEELEKYNANENFMSGLLNFLSTGNRLNIPNIVPDAIEVLMRELWNDDPDRRPSFKTCKKRIKKELSQSCGKLLLRIQGENLHASEVSVFCSDDRPNNGSNAKKCLRQRYLAVSIILFGIILLAAAAGLLSLVLLKQTSEEENYRNGTGDNVTKTLSDSAQTKNIELIAGLIPGGNSSILSVEPEGDGAYLFIFPEGHEKAVHLNLVTKLNAYLSVENPYKNENDNLIACDFRVVRRANRSFILALTSAETDYQLFTFVKNDHMLLAKERHDISIGINLSNYKANIYQDENDGIYCVTYKHEQNAKSGDQWETIIFAFKIIVEGNGKISSSVLLQRAKVSGMWSAPFIRSNILHWPIQIFGEDSALFRNFSGRSLKKISLSGGTTSLSSITNYSQCLFQNSSSYILTANPIQINKSIIFYFTTENRFKSVVCYVDLSQMAWRLFPLELGNNDLVNNVIIAAVISEMNLDPEMKERARDECRRYENIKDTDQSTLINNGNFNNVNKEMEDLPEYIEVDSKYEIESSKLTKTSLLGEGFFSDVYHGMLSQSIGMVPVAVKMPKHSSGRSSFDTSLQRDQRKVLREELKILTYIQAAGGHENVLKLIGATTKSKTDFCLITEYCEWGSIDKFLIRKFNNGEYTNEVVIQKSKNRAKDTQQIWKILHRDVALRNVLLKADFKLKLADFGLSKKLNDGDEAYQIYRNNSVLPIRYLAPESLVAGRFTIHSECWSFGIVVWELFTFAQYQPYAKELEKNYANENFMSGLLTFLSSGKRLKIPTRVPTAIEELLKQLWNEVPDQRPSLKTCRKLIRNELSQSCEPIILREKDNHLHSSEISLFRLDESQATSYFENKMCMKSIFGIFVATIILVAVVLAAIFIYSYRVSDNGIHSNAAESGTKLLSPAQHVKIIAGLFAEKSMICMEPNGDGVYLFFWEEEDISKVMHVNLATEMKTYMSWDNPLRNSKQKTTYHDFRAVRKSNDFYILALTSAERSHEFQLFTYVKKDQNFLATYKHDIRLGTNMSSISTNKIYQDEKGDIYCIFYVEKELNDYQYEKMGYLNHWATVIFAFKLSMDDNGIVTSKILLQDAKLNGEWSSPFIRSNVLYWPMKLSRDHKDFSGKKLNEISLNNGRESLSPIVDYDYRCSIFLNQSGHYNWVRNSIQIDDSIAFYFVKEGLRESIICYIDFVRMAWRHFYLNLNNYNVVKDVQLASSQNGLIGLHGKTQSDTPYFIVIDFKAIKEQHEARTPYNTEY